MKLQEIFDQLSFGEFSQISIGGQDAGVINECNYDRVISHINLGLTALYTRFKLKERRLVIPLLEGVTVYPIAAEDILKVDKILADSGKELDLNREGSEYSCFTPSLSVLQVPQIILTPDNNVPDDLHTLNLTVVYRANHPKLSMRFGILNATMKTIELPSSHLMALLYFVASRAYTPISLDTAVNTGNTWYAKYEATCQGLEDKGIQVDAMQVNTRLSRNGWV